MTDDRLPSKPDFALLSNEFRSNIAKHVANSGSIERFLAHLVFVGLPGSGKTLLIANLLNLEEAKKLRKASASTGVLARTVFADIEDKASVHAANIDTNCDWTESNFVISFLKQMGINFHI